MQYVLSKKLIISVLALYQLMAQGIALAAQDEQPGRFVQSSIGQQMSQSPKNTSDKLAALKGVGSVNANALLGMTREEVIQQRAVQTKHTQRDDASVFYDFSIDDAFRRLFLDADFDGFHQTFSVTFDANVSSAQGVVQTDVFADLYLSRDGGPWRLYFTTDPFTITGNTRGDEFEVLTTLDEGYPADHYDVMIDLYEVGFDDVVASVNSDDFNELFALPLESSDFDENNFIEVDVSDGGSLSAIGLIFLLLAFSLRHYVTRRVH